jgi:hypothetical protein
MASEITNHSIVYFDETPPPDVAQWTRDAQVGYAGYITQEAPKVAEQINTMLRDGGALEFPYLESNFGRGATIPVRFTHLNGDREDIVLGDKTKLKQNLESAANRQPKLQYLLEFCLSQDAYGFSQQEAVMRLQEKDPTLSSDDPQRHLQVTARANTIDVEYEFVAPIRQWRGLERVDIGMLQHKFANQIDRTTGTVKHLRFSRTFEPTTSAPFSLQIREDHFSASGSERSSQVASSTDSNPSSSGKNSPSFPLKDYLQARYFS